jgi:hypothetical protein
MDKELYNTIESIQNVLISAATGGENDEQLYHDLRSKLLAHSGIKNLIPEFIKSNRTLEQFWYMIKHEDPTYAGRRMFIWDSFSKALNFAENSRLTPAESAVSSKILMLDHTSIKNEWTKALDRKATDPEGAITMSRTLIETTCKSILDKLSVKYDDKLELPKLYKLTANQLKLGPSQHTEVIFKQILNGCQSVVEGLGTLRNKLSDSHGKKEVAAKPSERHAELAVNLAGTMTIFLFESYNRKINGG